MALGTHVRRGIAVTIGTLVVTTLSTTPVDGADAVPGASPVAFYTPEDGGTASGAVHVVLGADPGVVGIDLIASTDGGQSWTPVGGRLTRRTGSSVFETTWTAPAGKPSVQLQALGYDAGGVLVGVPAVETVNLASTATRFTFTTPGAKTAQVGVYKRADRRWFAALSGTTTGAAAPSLDAPLPPATVVTPPPATTLPSPVGVFSATAHTFTQPVDLSAYYGWAPSPARIPVRVRDGVSSDVVDAPVYAQTVTAVRSTTAKVAGTSKVTITARVTDQYGQPVTGAVVRLSGYASGASKPVAQLAVSNVLGSVTFTGPGAGSGPAAATGYGTGFYIAYADVDLNSKRGAKEPGYETVLGTVSYAAPGKAFYHNNKRISGAGGVLADSARGTRDAAAKGYKWIDQDGQLSYTTSSALRRGVARVSEPGHLTWINAHGAPFNPRWLKNGRFERHTWAAIRRHAGLRDAAATFRQNARYGISVEWEVKNVRPFITATALDAAFTNLAAAAKRYYGPDWAARVQVKVLSNLPGGSIYARKVLKAAHAHGFTTLYLARGKATRVQLPAAAHRYVTYVRGAQAGLYAPIPPASQNTPVTVTGPPPVARR